ncbi:hypothetical protein TrLO_g14856 [Triparma laevis f. longispina]|uniref:Uncharacterized protein n=1 Tax=Triparma laevis f. longispina TaxID=1714387 RepID=A0A9W7FTM0_9STRA|nr:hypothetical protein TrLO_g14856 [Triparma laevis f. longispina]
MSGFTDASGLPLPDDIAALLDGNKPTIESMDDLMLSTLSGDGTENDMSTNEAVDNLDNEEMDMEMLQALNSAIEEGEKVLKSQCIVCPPTNPAMSMLKGTNNKSQNDDLDDTTLEDALRLVSNLDVDDLPENGIKGDEEVIQMAEEVGLKVAPVNDLEQGWDGVFGEEYKREEEEYDPEDEERDFEVDDDEEEEEYDAEQAPPEIPPPHLQHPLLYSLSQTFISPNLLIAPKSTCFSTSLSPTLTLVTSSSGHIHLWSAPETGKPATLKVPIASGVDSGEYEVLRSQILTINSTTYVVVGTASGLSQSYTYENGSLTPYKTYDLTKQEYEKKDALAPQIYALNVLEINGVHFLIVGADDTIYVWDFNTARLIRSHGFHPAKNNTSMGGSRNPNDICYIFSSDWNQITKKGAIGLSDGTCRIVDFDLHCEQVLSLPIEGTRLTSTSWNFEGDKVLTGECK